MPAGCRDWSLERCWAIIFSVSVTSAVPRDKATARILELTGRPGLTAGQAWLVVTAGLPGTGKSTFARKLAKATGAVVLESDALRTALFSRPTHEKDESRLLFEALYAAAEQLLADGSSVIVDATNLRERDRERAYAVAASAPAELLVLHFRAPEAVIAERMTRRGNGGDPDDRSTAGLAVYTRMAETEEPVRREHWEIDTSDAGATESALQRAIETMKRTPAAVRRDTGGSIS
jgi:predicted kinase